MSIRPFLTALFCTFALTSMADRESLKGFEYGTVAAPDGTEWQSPERLSLNKLQPTAYAFHFATPASAKGVKPEASEYYQSLDGTWKFHWVETPEKRPTDFYKPAYSTEQWDDIEVPGCWNVQGLGKHGEMKYGVPLYVNQPVMFYHEVKVGDWKEGVMRQPKDQRYTTYKYPNEVGSYRRTFTVPASWKGRNVIINFDGVDSFFYLWINGHYVGFSKNSRNTASFDITPYLNKKGENVVAVEVYRSSDGSFLEAQDMFRLPGIFRSTYLTSTPQVKIEDLVVRTKEIKNNSVAYIDVDFNIADGGKKQQKGYNFECNIYPVKLYSDEIESRESVANAKGGTALRDNHVTLFIGSDLKLWSAEAPYRYVLVAELKDRKGNTIDCVSTYFGARTVEIRETKAEDDEFGLAGRYFYVNDKPVKLKGVNRHETSLDRGHAITHKQMEEEVMLMKRGNINHIRMSHYSNDPYMYYLCDKYGIYLEDECNLESHQYYYGDASLSHPTEWKAAHVARNMEMVHGHINHPSIVIWSLGNEAGPGDNFKAAYAAIKAFDESRPVQYERNNNIVDMGSNQYPSVAWVQGAVKGNYGIKYPFHISEYAHSMGNSLGNLVDYWEAMESTNFFCGGAIWDWVDQAIDTYTEDGTKYMGYGGDHGDWPNDGMFCLIGIILPDFTPKPQYYEVKKVYQNVGIKADWEHNAVTIFNKNYFTTLSDYQIGWTLVLDGKPVKKGEFIATRDIHGPRMEKSYRLPFNINELPADGEYYLNVELSLGKDMPWAEKGYVQMAEQLSCPFDMYDWAMPSLKDAIEVKSEGGMTIVSTLIEESTGQPFRVSFDDAQGCIHSLVYGGRTVIEPGCGPKLDAFRAPVDNDNWAWNQWFQLGLYDLQHQVIGKPVISRNANSSISVLYNVRSQAKTKGRAVHRPGKAGEPFERIEAGQPMTEDDFHFTTAICYTVYPDGTISVASSIVSSDPAVALPRLGYAMKLPKQLDQYIYYGRGPLNNYADRKTGSFVGLYKSTVKDQFVHFPKPQSMGNREEVRWCALTDERGSGLQFIANSRPGDMGGRVMSTSALPWSALQMTLAAHPHELPQSDGNYLHLDCQVTGLGGNSCGQGGPLDPDRVKGALHLFKFIIRPTKPGEDLSEKGKMWDMVESPVTIVRDRAGKVTIIGDGNVMDPSNIYYTITSGKTTSKPKRYLASTNAGSPFWETGEEAISLRDGGTISAWYEGNEQMKTTVTFPRIENVPVEVVYVSSEEGPGGEVGKNLVDGDPSTMWHTMYSITVGTYPHWVDFDCNEVRTIKGFTYLPRQDGGVNGNVKAYKVQLSMDGKTWGDAVCEGQFDSGTKEKRVLFPKPQKARYLRFTALSSQNGQEFASGAEFTVIAE